MFSKSQKPLKPSIITYDQNLLTYSRWPPHYCVMLKIIDSDCCKVPTSVYSISKCIVLKAKGHLNDNEIQKTYLYLIIQDGRLYTIHDITY